MGASQSSGNRNVEVQDELGEGYGGELRGKLCLSTPPLVDEQGLPASPKYCPIGVGNFNEEYCENAKLTSAPDIS